MKTKSEELFERFLTLNDIPFEKIEEIREKGSRRPDYLVRIGEHELIFEVKELAEDEKFNMSSNCRVPGDHIRRRICEAKRQIQYGADKGIPSILLVYNNIDPTFQMFGTDDLDFQTAMYGELTVLIDKNTGGTSDLFQGRKDELQSSKNTSFSSVGRLTNTGGQITVTLFENAYAKIKVPYELLPSCFRVRRATVSTEPVWPA